MFIIFGWGRKTLKRHGPVFERQCERCNNTDNWVLYTRRTWFTLFFIPVIPYSKEHLVICPVCSYGFVISNEKFKELKEALDGYRDIDDNSSRQIDGVSQRNKITQQPDRNNSSAYNSGNSYEYYGKTETQINYLRQMEELRRAKEEAERANKDVSDVQAEDYEND